MVATAEFIIIRNDAPEDIVGVVIFSPLAESNCIR